VKRGGPLKRSALQPGAKSLERGSTFASRGGQLSREPRGQQRPARVAARGRLHGTCICGCKQPAVARHHCIYEQELRRVYRARRVPPMRGGLEVDADWVALCDDPRNLVLVAFDCHSAHHGRSRPYPLAMLPDSVFEFAAEVLGLRAHDYLRRRYGGSDSRLDALLDVVSYDVRSMPGAAAMKRVAILCSRPACGHGPGRHEAGGACQDCACTAFTLEDITPPPLTRCSGCGRRPRAQSWHRDKPWGNHLSWCPRQGQPPDAPEREPAHETRR
jgi:hypothetical protein